MQFSLIKYMYKDGSCYWLYTVNARLVHALLLRTQMQILRD